MYYLTKEWYLSGKDGSLCLDHTPAEEARTFSEEYFQKLYAESEQKYLDSLRRDSLKDPSIEFDPETAKIKHRKRFLQSLEHIQREFPPEFLGMIADPRVYALGYATPEIIEEATAYCEACNRIRHETIMASWAQQKLRFADREPDFLKDCRFHDHNIKSGYFVGNNFIFEPAPSEHWTYIFANAEILLQEQPLDNVFGVYDEVFPTESGYEFHFILARSVHGHEDSFEFAIRCSDLIVIKPKVPKPIPDKYSILIETFIPGWKSAHRLEEYLDVETTYPPWVWVKLNGRFPARERTTSSDGHQKFITANDEGISVHYTFIPQEKENPHD